ncbi:hypothetical protein EV360DRAFT_71172 [Lentinula raphanica]|nr:hypothetical protein EV360DRAFT_71172 [Lentinula raphanica]
MHLASMCHLVTLGFGLSSVVIGMPVSMLKLTCLFVCAASLVPCVCIPITGAVYREFRLSCQIRELERGLNPASQNDAVNQPIQRLESPPISKPGLIIPASLHIAYDFYSKSVCPAVENDGSEEAQQSRTSWATDKVIKPFLLSKSGPYSKLPNLFDKVQLVVACKWPGVVKGFADEGVVAAKIIVTNFRDEKGNPSRCTPSCDVLVAYKKVEVGTPVTSLSDIVIFDNVHNRNRKEEGYRALLTKLREKAESESGLSWNGESWVNSKLKTTITVLVNTALRSIPMYVQVEREHQAIELTYSRIGSAFAEDSRDSGLLEFSSSLEARTIRASVTAFTVVDTERMISKSLIQKGGHKNKKCKNVEREGYKKQATCQKGSEKSNRTKTVFSMTDEEKAQEG